jgi:hypothetical protein
VHDNNDFRDYRRGRAMQCWLPKPKPSRRQELTDERRRERYATAIARAEFGRFYWNGAGIDEFHVAKKKRHR